RCRHPSRDGTARRLSAAGRHDNTPHEERPTLRAHAHAHADAQHDPGHSIGARRWPSRFHGGTVTLPTRCFVPPRTPSCSWPKERTDPEPARSDNGSRRAGGECGEVGAAGDLLLAYDIASRADAEALKRLASRVSAMLLHTSDRPARKMRR